MPVPWGKAQFDQFYRKEVERYGVPPPRGTTGPYITLGYHWFWTGAGQAGESPYGLTSLPFAQMIVELLGLVAGDAVLLVGCGFAYTSKGLSTLGIRVIGTDLSDYIQAEKGNTEEAEIRAACLAAGVDPDTDQVLGPGATWWNPLDLFMEGGRAAPAIRGKGEILEEELRTRGSRNAVLNRFEANWPGVSPRYIITEEVLNSIPDAEADLVCDYASAGASEWGATVVHMLSPPLESAQAGLNWKTYGAWRTWLNTNGYGSHLILPTVTAIGQGVTLPAGGEPGRVVAYSGLI